MGQKVLKSGKIVIILSGRYAGKKAVILSVPAPNTRRPFKHVLVAGLEKAPRQVTKSMGKKKILRRSKVKAFVKFINVSHIMPTRYNFPGNALLKVATPEQVDKISLRKQVRFALHHFFTRSYLTSENVNAKQQANHTYFFERLRF